MVGNLNGAHMQTYDFWSLLLQTGNEYPSAQGWGPSDWVCFATYCLHALWECHTMATEMCRSNIPRIFRISRGGDISIGSQHFHARDHEYAHNAQMHAHVHEQSPWL